MILEVDHIIAVAKGGADEDHNLLTACFDCNRGKRDGSLTRPEEPSLERRRELLAERQRQVEAYDELLFHLKIVRDQEVDQVSDALREHTNCSLAENGRRSVSRFLDNLTLTEVLDSIEIAVENIWNTKQFNDNGRQIKKGKKKAEKVFKYFCGVCWNRINRR